MVYNLGQVAIVNKGAWASGTTYAVLNTVTLNGGSFMCIAANSNVQPGVTSGWASYWVAMSRGIKTVDIVADTTTTAHAVFTLSDGSTVTGTTFNTSGIPDNSVTASKLSGIKPEDVGIKHGTATPTTSTISDGQIYLQYS